MSLNNVVGSEQNECSGDEFVKVSRKKLEMVVSPEDFQSLQCSHLYHGFAKERSGQEKLLTNKKGNSENEISTSEPISLKLQFNPVKISSPVLTGKKIKGEGCPSIKVALVDCLNEKIVKSRPEASAKVEIVVLEGGFDSVEAENWTSEEFENKIVREKSLLVGNVNLNLKGGIVSLGEIHFKHTNTYRRKCEFRLGARVVDNFNSIRIKEAKTETFTVKDGRRKYQEKHYPPSPSDAVWRLERIGKNGRLRDRLTEANIITVEDFLTWHSIDPQRLQKILKVGDMRWKVIVGHAQQCRIDKKEVDADKSVVSALEHREEVVPCDEEIDLEGGSAPLSNAFNPSNSPSSESLSGNNLATSEMMAHDFHTQPSTSSAGGLPFSINDEDILSFDKSVAFAFEHREDVVLCDEEIDLRRNDYYMLDTPLLLFRNCGKEIQPSESKSLQLQFLNTLYLPVFTGTRIEDKDCSTLKVALFDALNGEVVSCGRESSAKVEIVVLEGDFDDDEQDNWTLEDFKNSIVRERQGKKPLLTGESFFYLKEGIGLVGEISFTDNSSWTRSRKFRLGARVVDSCDGIRVREAKTDSFVVSDHQGELYKKHHPPSLLDEVWRLEKIGKEGDFHKRLSREKINTVQDFLTLLFLDPTKLRNILGTGMSAKMWEVTVEHAKKCVLDKSLYMYGPASQLKTRVIFNAVGQVIGLLSDCQYVPTDKLSETEKADAHDLVISAYKHWEEVVCIDDEASLIDGFLSLSKVVYPSNSPMTGYSDGNKVSTSHKIDWFDYQGLNASSPDIMPSIYSVGGVSSLVDYGLHSIDWVDVRFDHHLGFSGQVANSLIYDTDSVAQAFCGNEHLQYFENDQNPSFESEADLQTAVSGFLLSPTTAVKAQSRWTVLFRSLRWSSKLRNLVRKTRSETQRYH